MSRWQWKVLAACFVAGVLGSVTLHADDPRLCTGTGTPCVTSKCLSPFRGVSCAQLTAVAFNVCQIGNGTCPEQQVKCADVAYYTGVPCTGDFCTNGIPGDTDSENVTGCKALPPGGGD